MSLPSPWAGSESVARSVFFGSFFGSAPVFFSVFVSDLARSSEGFVDFAGTGDGRPLRSLLAGMFAAAITVGWTAGAGIEGAFTDHWTARVEYLFVDLQNSTFTPVVGTNITTKFNANLIRLGVDYKF